MIKTQCGGNFCCVKVCSGNFKASTLIEPVFHVAMNALPHEKKAKNTGSQLPGIMSCNPKAIAALTEDYKSIKSSCLYI